MNILLDILPIIILAVCIIIYIASTQNLRTETKSLKQAKAELLKEIEEDKVILKGLNEQQQKLINDIKEAAHNKQVSMQQAAEAKELTDKLLQSEQERLKAQTQAEKELAQVKLDEEYDQKKRIQEVLYQRKINELEQNYNERKAAIDEELEDKQETLNKFCSIIESVNEAIRRAKELKEKEDFYSLQISDNDKEDIRTLQSMDLKLHHRDVIPKIIWELFIRRAVQEMEKRVLGSLKHTGIYKITNKLTGEAYIGKSTDISTRWQNHCKTSIGLEGAAHATLHTRMAQDGIWNYTFEILEDVDKDHLSEREAFYIDLYGTKTQLNMKEGSK